MQNLDVCKKESGKIWIRKPSPSSDNGLVATVTHSVSTTLSLPSRNIRFLHSAFDTSGDRFIAGDHQGNVYLFDLSRNRFSLVQRTGSACTAVAFSLRRRTEFLVAMSDYSLKCYDTDTKELVAWMKGHDAAIHTISVHASGRYALTSSADTSQLWDLDTFQRKRKLNIRENVGIVKVFFLPLSNTIITCFKDDTVFAWESDTLNCKYQLPVPPGGNPQYKAFAVTRDGRMLVAGGKSHFLHVWALDTRRLLRIVQLPTKVTCVRHLEFLPDSFDAGASQVLGVLSQDGILRFVNVNTCKLLFDVGSLDNRIMSVCVGSNGRHIVTITEDGNLQIYSVQALTSELNQPPPPLVKVLHSNKMADTTGSSSQSKKVKLTRPGVSQSRKNKSAESTKLSTETDLPEGLDQSRLMAILKGYGEYPAKYRMFIWRSILHLPENHAAFAALLDKGTHPAYEKLHEDYPIKSRKLLRVLQRTLSALAHWAPIFGETKFLPLLAFPFIKIFQNNQLVCFEVIATLLVNWCQHWFEYFPNPPINMLGMVENVLAHHDKELLQHFIRYGVTSQLYAWPVLETLFSEVFTREEWLKLMDNIFSNHPAYILMVTVAYCTCSRGPLIRCTEFDDFKYFFHHRNAVDVDQVIKEAYRLLETTPSDIQPQRIMEEFQPLTKGQYPVFNKYPKFIVDYQAQERERIRQEEFDYLRQRQASMELQQETSRRQQEEEAWYRQQQLLLEAEEKRRHVIADEEQKLADQRTRLQAMNRELKSKELQLLDATRRKFMNHVQNQKQAELKRLDDEIQRKALLRDRETESAMDDAQIRNMELQLQKKMFEQDMYREHVKSTFQQTAEYEARRKQQEIEEQIMQNMQKEEMDRELKIRKSAQEKLAEVDHVNMETSLRNELDHRARTDELDRDLKQSQIMRLHENNRLLEHDVQDMMRRVHIKPNDGPAYDYREIPLYAGGRAAPAFTESAADPRMQLLKEETDRAHGQLVQMRQSLNDSFDKLQKLKRSVHVSQPDHALNSTTTTDSTQLSLDRGRHHFEEQEKELMSEVRKLRQRLAQENRKKRPPPVPGAD